MVSSAAVPKASVLISGAEFTELSYHIPRNSEKLVGGGFIANLPNSYPSDSSHKVIAILAD